MAVASSKTNLQLIAGHCYAMQVTDLHDLAVAHKSIRQDYTILRTTRLTFLAYLRFDAFPEYCESVCLYLETETSDDNAHPLGTAFVDPENPQITVVLDAATIAAILDAVSNGIELSFTLTGLAIDREKLEVVEFCYDYEL